MEKKASETLHIENKIQEKVTTTKKNLYFGRWLLFILFPADTTLPLVSSLHFCLLIIFLLGNFVFSLIFVTLGESKRGDSRRLCNDAERHHFVHLATSVTTHLLRQQQIRFTFKKIPNKNNELNETSSTSKRESLVGSYNQTARIS